MICRDLRVRFHMLNEARGYQSCSYVACPHSLCSLLCPSSSPIAARIATEAAAVLALRRPVLGRAVPRRWRVHPLLVPLQLEPARLPWAVVVARAWVEAAARALLVVAAAARAPVARALVAAARAATVPAGQARPAVAAAERRAARLPSPARRSRQA